MNLFFGSPVSNCVSHSIGRLYMGEPAKLLPQAQGYGCFEGLPHNDHHAVKTPERQGSNALELPMNGNYGKDEVADARY